MSHGTEKRARSRNLTIRLTEDERLAIDAAALADGLTAGSYARTRLLDGPIPRQVRRPPADHRELARLLAELGKIGSNLNQLAKATNQGRLVYDGEVEVACQALDELRLEILRALGRVP